MATLQPPPFRTAMYDNGVLHPAWWQWFNQLFNNVGATSGDSGIDDQDPPAQYVTDTEALQQTATLLAGLMARNDELEKTIEGVQLSPRIEIPPAVFQVAAGIYTPVAVNVANLDATPSLSECQYMRVGNVVTVSGVATVNPTLVATVTQLGIPLPIASNFAAVEDCAGTAFASGIAGQGAAIIADASNNRAEMQWISGDVTNQTMQFIFTYQVI